MKWFRSLAAELFPWWHERRLLRRLKGDNYASLESMARLRRSLESAQLAEMERDPATAARRAKKSPE
jgi:hypothetical protein